jgi:hypothetical protein
VLVTARQKDNWPPIAASLAAANATAAQERKWNLLIITNGSDAGASFGLLPRAAKLGATIEGFSGIM